MRVSKAKRDLIAAGAIRTLRAMGNNTLQTIYGPVDMTDPRALRAHARRVILEESTRDDRNGAARLAAAQKLLEMADELEGKASKLDQERAPGALKDTTNVTELSEAVRKRLAAERYATRNGKE